MDECVLEQEQLECFSEDGKNVWVPQNGSFFIRWTIGFLEKDPAV